MVWWEAAGRSAAVFLALLVWTRILGKKVISQMTFFDFVAGVAIGSIGANAMFNRTIPFSAELLGLSVFCAIALLSDYVSLKSIVGRKVLDSESSIVIKDGKILEEGMTKARLTVDGLLLLLRKKDVFYVDEVELAYFEVDGTLSVLRKAGAMPATREDVASSKPSRGRPQALVIDGKLMPYSIREAGKDEAWVERELRRRGIADVADVMFMQVDGSGNVYVDVRNDGESTYSH
ncbi:DUF421 domain-containing protein [Paenibacillus sp.]|uniref:DUF421 domain-containing protein n=1 Tax=Paenibacillus sp. TaxID=58172 RepID=UPI002D6BA5CA|nr:DUF421 domain-containing protein [Paenibacillus sp.]HZG85041.1 DUF421 domain-containing protein [Paenibacillus sp.]